MKKRKLTLFILLAVLILMLSMALVACDKGVVVNSPSYIKVELPANSISAPLDYNEGFDFSQFKLRVVFDDGSMSEPIKFDPAMITNDALDQLYNLKENKRSRISYTIQYTYKGKTLAGNFAAHFKKTQSEKNVKFTFYTNGAGIDNFSVEVKVGTEFETYADFERLITKSRGDIKKTRCVLDSWYDIGGNRPNDFSSEEALKTDKNTIRLNKERTFLPFIVRENHNFYATWVDAVAKITFDYNFYNVKDTTKSQVKSDSILNGINFYHRTLVENRDRTEENRFVDKFTNITRNNTIVVENYLMSVGMIQRPLIYLQTDDVKNNVPLTDIVAGYRFEGWYTDQELTKVWSFSGYVTDNMTLYAKWVPKEYKVTFDLGGGILNDELFFTFDAAGDKKFFCENALSENNIAGSIDYKDEDGNPTTISYTGLGYQAQFSGYAQKTGKTGRYLFWEGIENDQSITLGQKQINGRLIYKSKIGENSYYYDFAGWYLDPLFSRNAKLDYTTSIDNNLKKQNSSEFLSRGEEPKENLVLYAKWSLRSTARDDFYLNNLFKDQLILKDDGTFKIAGVADKSITELRIPKSIVKDGEEIFISEIGEGAFQSCLSLLKVEIEGGEYSQLTTIGDKAFAYCNKLFQISKVKVLNGLDGSVTVVGVDILEPSSEYELNKLENIGVDAFQATQWLINNRYRLDFLVFKNILIQYIGDKSVTNIVSSEADLPIIGDVTEDEGHSGFDLSASGYEVKKYTDNDELHPHVLMYEYTASQLPTYKYVILPSGVTATNPDGITTINPYAFKSLTKLTSIEIPKTVKKIGNYAFFKCESLDTFIVEPISGNNETPVYNLEFVGSSALADTKIIEAQGFTTIGKILYAYRGTNAVTTVNIPKVEIIADNLFKANGSIRNVTFENESFIKSIGINAFNETQWYRDMATRNDGFVIVNGILIGFNKRIANDGTDKYIINIPDTVREIASFAFVTSSNATHICLPNSIEKINEYAFESCINLKSVSFEHIVKANDLGGSPLIPYVLKDEQIEDGKQVGMSKKAFFNSVTQSMVSRQMKVYLTHDDVGNKSCFLFATTTNFAGTDGECPLYAFYNRTSVEPKADRFVQELKTTTIRIKNGTFESEYVREPGWSLQSYWAKTEAFMSKAKIELIKSDGLIYEHDLQQSMISGIDNSLSNSQQVVGTDGVKKYPHGYNVYDSVRTFDIAYVDANGIRFSCTFDYVVRPQISSISVSVDPNSYMGQAKYYTTSRAFIYEGGSITIDYAEDGVESQTIKIADLFKDNQCLTTIDALTALLNSDFNPNLEETGINDKTELLNLINARTFKISTEGKFHHINIDEKNFKEATGAEFKIKNFISTSPQLYRVNMQYKLAGQVVKCEYEYQVNRPEITKIEAKKPIEFDIASIVNKSDLSDVMLILSRNDAINGGQIFVKDNSNNLHAYSDMPQLPADTSIAEYIIYYPKQDVNGGLVNNGNRGTIFETIVITVSVNADTKGDILSVKKTQATLGEDGNYTYSDVYLDDFGTGEDVMKVNDYLKQYLNVQDVAISAGTILLYGDDQFSERLTTFDTSTEGRHFFYAKYNDDSGATVGDSELTYQVNTTTSQVMFNYELDKTQSVQYDNQVLDKGRYFIMFDEKKYYNNGIATITGINKSHWSVVSIPEIITESKEVPKLAADGTQEVVNGEPQYEIEYYFYVVTSIEAEAFMGDENLYKIYFSKYIKAIGDRAFKDCKNLSNIYLLDAHINPNLKFGYETIGVSAFENCSALTEVVFNENLEYIGAYAFKKSGLEKVDFSNNFAVTGVTSGVREIELQTFFGCIHLVTLNLEGVKSLNNQAFESCVALTEITIPDCVDEMGNYVFNACINLTKIHIEDTTPDISEGQGLKIGPNSAFGALGDAKIYVSSEEAKNAFIADVNWRMYQKAIKVESSSVAG